MHGYHAGAVPTVHVGAHTRETRVEAGCPREPGKPYEKGAQGFVYLDLRISFQEIDRYFLSGCACAFFQVATDVYTDLRYNQEEWEPIICQEQ